MRSIPKFIKICSVELIFDRHLRKIGICFGNRPIADFFHDQTIFLKDYELYIIGHSLSYSAKVFACLKFQNLSKFCSDLRKIGICFGNRPIAYFFHDQIIFLKDYDLFIIGHSLATVIVQNL